MRLSKKQIDTIKSGAAEVFGEDAHVFLFGSRVNDTQRGGDIDLYIELPEMTEEQKIDVVTHVQGTPMRPTDQQARVTGVRL